VAYVEKSCDEKIKTIPTPMNGKCWRVRTIISILSNEKYKGDALLQKTYAVDWLNKKRGKNTGQLPQYYIEGSHPAIISPAVFDLVQNEIAKRKDQHKRNTGPFSNIIICGDCGAYYGRKVWHAKTKYKSSIWFCNSKYKGQHICKTPNIRDEQLRKAFVEAFNMLIQNKDLYVSKAQKRINSLIDTSVLEKKLESKETEYDEAYKALKDLVDSNSSRLQNQDEYTKKFNEAESRFQIFEKEISELNTRIASTKAQREKIAIYLNTLKADNKIIEEFNEDLWYAYCHKEGMVLPVQIHVSNSFVDDDNENQDLDVFVTDELLFNKYNDQANRFNMINLSIIRNSFSGSIIMKEKAIAFLNTLMCESAETCKSSCSALMNSVSSEIKASGIQLLFINDIYRITSCFLTETILSIMVRGVYCTSVLPDDNFISKLTAFLYSPTSDNAQILKEMLGTLYSSDIVKYAKVNIAALVKRIMTSSTDIPGSIRRYFLDVSSETVKDIEQIMKGGKNS